MIVLIISGHWMADGRVKKGYAEMLALRLGVCLQVDQEAVSLATPSQSEFSLFSSNNSYQPETQDAGNDQIRTYNLWSNTLGSPQSSVLSSDMHSQKDERQSSQHSSLRDFL